MGQFSSKIPAAALASTGCLALLAQGCSILVGLGSIFFMLVIYLKLLWLTIAFFLAGK